MSGRLIPFRRSAPRALSESAAQSGSAQGSRSPEPAGAATSTRPPEASRLRELILAHMDDAYSLARYLSRDPTAAEDIAQDALLKAVRGAGQIRGDEIKPWLLAIVRNAYFDWRRRTDARTVTGPAADVAMAEAPDLDQPSAEAALIRSGEVAALRRAIETIPEPFREALVLRELEELNYRQIAEVTGAPLGTVMSRLSRARDMLAERMGLKEAAS
jgi:RNA polymerase sigma factor (sigma-70 family)